MHLIEILLPTADNESKAFDSTLYHSVKDELTEGFGGVTVFARAPAQGLWKDGSDTKHDEIIIYEVMAEYLDKVWWHDYRLKLQEIFKQEVVVIRAAVMTLL